jgi:hypothetical protein
MKLAAAPARDTLHNGVKNYLKEQSSFFAPVFHLMMLKLIYSGKTTKIWRNLQFLFEIT